MLHETIREGSEKRRIWQICDELEAAKGRIPTGSEVVAVYEGEGGNYGTGHTQYSHWKKARAAAAVTDNAAVDASWISADLRSVDPTPITISADGSMTLPAEIARSMMIGPDGRASAKVINGELRIVSQRVGIRQAQLAVAPLKTGASIVDELIAERRAEGRLEDSQ